MSAEYDPTSGINAWEGDEEGYGMAGGSRNMTQLSAHQDRAFPTDRAHDASGDSPSNGPPSDDAGDYDPESITSSVAVTPQIVEPQTSVKPSPQPQSKKPKTAGGFIVGDSESDDDDDASTPASNTLAPPTSASHLRTHSPLQQSMTANETAQVPSATTLSSQFNRPSVPPVNGHGTITSAGPQAASRSNVPRDRIAILEERVREDPRGAMDAWMGLIAEYRLRNVIDELRSVFDRFLAVFPQAADIWTEYLDVELSLNNFVETERIFGQCLMSTPNVAVWTKYLDYIRRRNDLNDSSGKARQVVAQAYEFVIDNIGCDKDSGKIWTDYINFIKFGPGQVGGSSWQDQQKMDQLRKAYQRAICVPIQCVNTLWKEYDQFEMGLNKTTGRKFLAERSPAYMSAKSANTALENVTRGLQRNNLPRLPPAPGFDGDLEYAEQVQIWNKWIAWEKSDPLDVKTDDPELLQTRVHYAYRQALMALRYWPEMWVDAAEWAFENSMSKDGTDIGLDFLRQGITANPESILLALKHADRIETTYPIEENESAKIMRGEAVREPYKKVLETLYDLIKSLKEREKAELTKIEEAAARESSIASVGPKADEDEEDEDVVAGKAEKETARLNQAKAIQKGFAAQTQLLQRMISFTWVALARAMRRIQGKGKPGTDLGGMRQVFTEARQRGKLTSDVYVAIAQLEWMVYKDPAGAKIFDRGSKLFPEDENFTVEYLKFLHSRDDFTNARVVFETCVNRLTQKPELVHKAKPLYAYFHKYESQFGELAQVAKLEKRMTELFPQDPKLSHFNARFSTDKFDPIAARIIISPASQLKPKIPIMASIEQPISSAQNSPRPSTFRVQNSPRPQIFQALNSPKRPFPIDDDELNPPRKMHRGEQQEFMRGASPLKGAAGRRLDQQRRQGVTAHTSTAPTIPRDVTFLLGLIPPADTYQSQRYSAAGMVRLLQDTEVPDYVTYRNRQQGGQRQAPSHTRHISSDYAHQSGFGGSRNSPNPPGRALSPYTGEGGHGRVMTAPTTYRQSSLRPGSSGSYEPPPAAYAQSGLPPPLTYGHAPPPPPGAVFDSASGAWSMYGAAPPPPLPSHQGYAPPPIGYAPPGPPPQAPYNRYPF